LCNNRGKGSISFAQGPLSNDYMAPHGKTLIDTQPCERQC